MVKLNIICVILSILKSSNAAAAFRNYFLRDLAYLGTEIGPSFRASPNATPEVHFVNVNSEDNNTAKKPGYGDEWVYALHTDEGQAEWLDLTTAIHYEPQEILANRSLDFMAIQLFTRRNKDQPENLTVDPYFEKPILRSQFFDPSKRTKVFTHGWSPEAIGLEEFKNLTSIYLELGDFNVIYVTWSAVSSEEYMLPVILFPYLSRRVSVLLRAIIDTFHYTQDMHLIGHGVGAHIMGYAAELSEKTISRVTGLDPERPFFEKPQSKLHHLGKNDARFVDIIHTCKGIRGYKRNNGHVDFYPNLGKSPQPGCNGYPVLKETCSHFRALFYYIESLVSDKHFYAYKCKDFNSGKCNKKHTLMGEHVFHNLRGPYYLNTNEAEPFAMGKHVYLEEEPDINVTISDSNPPDDDDDCNDNEDAEENDEGGKEKESGADGKDKENNAGDTRQRDRDNTDVDEKDYDAVVLASSTPKLLEPLRSLNVDLTKLSGGASFQVTTTSIKITTFKKTTMVDIT